MFNNIIDKYSDYEKIGTWCCYNVETKETTEGGDMYKRSIKVRRDNGQIDIDYEYITDNDVKDESLGK